jgi:hypothetical protein
MEKILTFDQLFEANEKKISWMPSIEEFNSIEPYKGLLASLGGTIQNSYERPQTTSSINRGVRFIRLGATYACKVSPVSREETGEKVNFTYGAYKIYSNIPFSTKEEREKAMELFILYSLSKTSGYNMNQGIFGDIEKYLVGKKEVLDIKESHAYEFIDGFIKSAESINDPYSPKPYSLIRMAYLINRYLKESDNVAIFKVIETIERIGTNKANNNQIIRGLLRYTDVDSLCKYMKENPLELYILDDLPEIKEEVLKRTGIKDYGKIGKSLHRGLL